MLWKPACDSFFSAPCLWALQASGVNFLAELGGKFVQGHSAQIFTGPGADGDSMVFNIPVANHQHIGDFLQRRLADFLADLLIPDIRFRPETLCVQSGGNLCGVAVGAVGDGIRDCELYTDYAS